MTLIVGCSTFKDLTVSVAKSAFGAGKEGGIELDTQIGDNKTDLTLSDKGDRATGDIVAKGKAQVSVTNQKTESQVDSAESVSIVNNSMPVWYLVLSIFLMILFWELPRFSTMQHWFIDKFSKKEEEATWLDPTYQS